MKRKLMILLAGAAVALAVWAKQEVKRPDSYAFTRGTEAYSEEKYAEAMEWFERELSEHPDNGYAYLYVGGIRYINDENGRALTALENALRHIPKKDKEARTFAFLSRAAIHATMGDTLSAMADIGLALKADPKNTDAYEKRAQILYEQKRYDLSDADYRKMTELDPGSVMGYMGLGRNANLQKNWEEALRQFDRVIRLAPDYSSGYSFRATALLGLEKWGEATDDIVKALDINGDDRAFHMMQVLPKEAASLMKSKLKLQMAKQPTNRYWPFCLGSLARADGDYEEAISFYEEANAIDANSVFLENISRCYLELDETDKALDYVERALAMNPEDYDLVDLKGDVLSRQGRYQEALTERDRYVAKYPGMAYAYMTRAEEHMNVHDFNKALEDYDMTAVILPVMAEDPYFHVKRGDVHRFLGNAAEAAKDYEEVLRLEADSTLSSKSWTPFAYSGLGNTDKAIETMQYILANDTTDVKGDLYNAACVYARVGMTDEALEYLRKAIDNGYKTFSHMKSDYDLDNLRDLPGYQEILSLMESESVSRSGDTEEEAGYATEVVEVPFTKEGGVTKVRCSINGLPLHFVFDTGAADVTMSMVEANFMVKNDYVKPSDIIGSARYMDANGDVTEGTVINLREVDFGGLRLENVRASVVRNQMAPLLLGQSVLGRLGKIEIDNPGQKLVITHRVRK